MGICSTCGSRLGAAAARCPNCGTELADADDEPPGPSARALARGSDEPSIRRPASPVTALPRAPAQVPRVAPRHNAALDWKTLAREDETGPSRAAALRPAEPERAPDRGAQVVPLRREGAGAPTSTEPAAAGSERHPVPPAPEAAARASTPPPPAPRPASADASGRVTPAAQSAARPPVLASEALRKDLAPAAPATRTGRLWTAVLGLLGLGAAWLACGPHGLGVPMGGAFLALVVLGLVPMPYPARAAALVTVAGSGLTIVTAQRLERATGLEPLVLMVGTCVLAMALLFRSWHRASLLSRALVPLGIALCAGWLWMSRSLPQLLILDSAWQAWLPPVLSVPLALILMLSLLAFMDSRSTGACGAWAVTLLGWYTLYTWVELLGRYWPAHSAAFELARVAPDSALALLSEPLFTAGLALGLAQLLAVATASEE